MKVFKGKVAVVTGAGSGIGQALAEKFASEGMKVVLADIQPESLDKAVQALKARGAEALGVVTDVSDPAQVKNLADRTLKTFGGVHILCNNAGVCKGGLSWQTPIEDYEWVLGVNLWGVIYGVRTFMPIFEKQGGEAYIVNTSSQSGITTTPYSAEYCISKHAILAFSEVVYKELLLTGSPVRISVVCPASVLTNIATAEPKRPSRFKRGIAPDKDVQEFMTSALTEEVQKGIPPAEMANQVFEAIKEERFYILPAAGKWRHLIELRLEDIRLGRNPTLEF